MTTKAEILAEQNNYNWQVRLAKSDFFTHYTFTQLAKQGIKPTFPDVRYKDGSKMLLPVDVSLTKMNHFQMANLFVQLFGPKDCPEILRKASYEMRKAYNALEQAIKGAGANEDLAKDTLRLSETLNREHMYQGAPFYKLQLAIYIFEPWQYSVKKGMAVVNTQLDDWHKKIKNWGVEDKIFFKRLEKNFGEPTFPDTFFKGEKVTVPASSYDKIGTMRPEEVARLFVALYGFDKAGDALASMQEDKIKLAHDYKLLIAEKPFYFLRFGKSTREANKRFLLKDQSLIKAGVELAKMKAYHDAPNVGRGVQPAVSDMTVEKTLDKVLAQQCDRAKKEIDELQDLTRHQEKKHNLLQMGYRNRKRVNNNNNPLNHTIMEKKISPEAQAPKGSLAAQYADLKLRHPASVILLRSGDFYKALNEDAAKVSEALGIALIHPNDPGNGLLQAGFPHHALDMYLPKLIRAGYRVAITDSITQKKEKKVAEDKKKETKKTTTKAKAKTKAQVKEIVTPKENVAEKTDQKAQDKTQAQKAGEELKPKAPQMVTVNGEKVTHAHAFQSTKYPDTWYFTARLEDKQLRPMVMKQADVEAYKAKKSSIPELMQHYYPTKVEKKVTPELYKADMTLSDGRQIEKMNVFKEKDENSQDFGKYKLFAKVDGQEKGMAVVMTTEDLNRFFDRVTTPRQLVEKNFGERLGLASYYQQFKLPEEAKVSDIRVFKNKEGRYAISAAVEGHGRTHSVELGFNDRQAFFDSKTASREQLVAKVLGGQINDLMHTAVKEDKSKDLKL